MTMFFSRYFGRARLRALVVGFGLIAALGTAIAAGIEHKVGQKNKEFSAAEVTIKPGESVVFTNDDDVAHNVFCNNPDCKFNTKIQTPGTKSPVKFEKEGTYEVRCAIHPKMKLTVHVKK
jgi:plastocyanin